MDDFRFEKALRNFLWFKRSSFFHAWFFSIAKFQKFWTIPSWRREKIPNALATLFCKNRNSWTKKHETPYSVGSETLLEISDGEILGRGKCKGKGKGWDKDKGKGKGKGRGRGKPWDKGKILRFLLQRSNRFVEKLLLQYGALHRSATFSGSFEKR